ncbi:hypothetical protein MHIR_DE00248 [Candidatus Doolittlea endobia]|uniref:Uncharacterized protein n=1 Tax=Candidatus Doolittlea endobia TaxID=1778262 RepID=A0A143WS24_9ENTR|nr:hypothetical protein MHIR_DE00248 [Candidatus Doolittlea endobia]
MLFIFVVVEANEIRRDSHTASGDQRYICKLCSKTFRCIYVVEVFSQIIVAMAMNNFEYKNTV